MELSIHHPSKTIVWLDQDCLPWCTQHVSELHSGNLETTRREVPQESYWFLDILLHKYLFYLCICEKHKYMEEYKYTFHLLICAVMDCMWFDWTNTLSKTPELLTWIGPPVPLNGCHIGPTTLNIVIGIKWYSTHHVKLEGGEERLS